MVDGDWQELPAAADLLGAAHTVLINEVIPQLPAEARFPALMAANAIAIARRATITEAPPALAHRLRALAGGSDVAALRRFAADIRDGTYDPGMPRRAEAAGFLFHFARHRSAVSNPKTLA